MFLWLKIGVWFPIATILYPVISVPIMLPMMLARPLQLLGVLAVTGLRVISLELAIAFIVAWCLGYSWSVVVPPSHARGYVQWARSTAPGDLGKLSQIVLMVALLGLFLYFMESFEFSPILKWFASFGAAYYLATVAMGIVNFPTMVAGELKLRKRFKNG